VRPSTIEPCSATALQMFRSTLQRRGPDAALVHYFDRSLTAGQLDAMSDGLAVALQQHGTEPGDRIAMYMQNVPQVVVTVLAAWKCARWWCCATDAAATGARRFSTTRKPRADLPDTLRRRRPRRPALDRRRHTITTSALDFLAPREAPRVLAGLRARSPSSVGPVALVAHAGQSPEPDQLTADAAAFMVYTSHDGEPKAALNTHPTSCSRPPSTSDGSDRPTILGLRRSRDRLIGHVSLALLTGSPLILFYRSDEEVCSLAHRFTSPPSPPSSRCSTARRWASTTCRR
jgi:long-chain acyl-CoA synthetase